MKLGLMQPYFFPYLGYFDLINQTDRWIVFDTVQHIKHGWVNRNRILHPKQGWQYVGIRLKGHPLTTPILAIEAAESANDWKTRIVAQLQHYKKRAPYFRQVVALIEEAAASTETAVARISVRSQEVVCRYLDIPFHYDYFSTLQLALPPVKASEDWALFTAQAVGAAEYVNPPGGVDLYDPAKFAAADIRLTIRNLPPMTYPTPGFEFIPHLSILDVMMCNPPEAIKDHLQRHADAQDTYSS